MNEFLSLLWDGRVGWGELRSIKDGKVEQTWLGLPVRDEDIPAHQPGWNVYMGVLPRTRKQGTADACVGTTDVLWADVDAKRVGSKPAALYGLMGIMTPPSIIIDSGHGYHGYWLLRDPAPFDDAQKAMRGLANQVCGDAVYDKARVLRLPGTLNYKEDPPLPVRILHLDPGQRYRLADFSPYVPDKPWVLTSTLKAPNYTVYRPLPDWLATLIVGGPPPGSDRSAQCFKVAAYLGRIGYSDVEIERVFADHPTGIGAKYAEKGRDAHRWATVTIRAARS